MAHRVIKPAPALETRVPELDGLRGVAVLAVLVFHYFSQHGEAPVHTPASYMFRLFSIGWAGVDLFFVLSGFLVGGILMDRKRSENLLQVFYIRRALRILPAYLLLLGLYSLEPWWQVLLPGTGREWLLGDPLPRWSYFLYLQNIVTALTGNFGPHFVALTWSLAVEEQFYLVFPWFVRRCPDRWMPTTFVALIVVAPVLRIALFIIMPTARLAGVAGYVLLPTRCDSLMVGALVAWMVRQAEWRERLVRWHGRLCLMLSLGILGIALMPIAGWTHSTFPMAAVGHTELATTAGLLLALLATGGVPYLALLFRSSPLRSLGGISYFVYLFQDALLGLFFCRLLSREPHLGNGEDFAVTVVSLGVLLSLAAISRRFFEGPLVGVGHRYRYEPDVASV